jgi:hypothetical protein
MLMWVPLLRCPLLQFETEPESPVAQRDNDIRGDTRSVVNRENSV